MSKITWKGGKDLSTAAKDLQDRADYIIAQAELAVKLSIEDGAVALQDFLEAAVTGTGIEREISGGFPGRHRSGKMVGSISYNDDNLRHEGKDVTWGDFGWFAGEFEAYFKEQDLGEGNIPAANAMFNAMNHAIARYQDRLAMIVAGEPVK